MPPRYQNFGGQLQLVVDDHEDLARIHELDPARWAATSAPIEDLNLDPRFVKLLLESTGARLRVSHLVAARDWVFRLLRRHQALDEASDTLVLADVDDSCERGRRLLQEAEAVQDELQLVDRSRLSLAELRQARKAFDATLANGDGLVVPGEVPGARAAELSSWILATVGGREDSEGKQGVGHDEIGAFLEGAAGYRRWRVQPETEADLLPLGGETAAAHALLAELEPKLEEYFLLCGLAAQEGPQVGTMRLNDEELRALRAQGRPAVEAFLVASPLHEPSAEARLPLDGTGNALYKERLLRLRDILVRPVLGAQADWLSEGGLDRLRRALAPYRAWLAARPTQPFHEVPAPLLEPETLQGLASELGAVVDRDLAASERLGALRDLEKLILLQRWLLVVARNLVSFQALYDPDRPALFQMGSLILDGRRLELTVRVRDRARHRKVAETSKTFLVYVAVQGDDGKTAFEVAAPITAGERGRVGVGKRGILLGRDGREWDAEVVEVVENSISVLEAVKAPFHRMADFVYDRFQAMAKSSLENAEKSIATVPVAGVIAPPAAAPAAPAPEAPRSSLQNMVVMLSLATAALGSAAAFVLRALAETNPLRIMGSLLGVVFLIGLTSGFLGWIRLRRRDMGPLLEANGWAVNVPLALTRELGALFTRIPHLPGEDRRWGRIKTLLAILLVLAAVLFWDEARLRVRAWLQQAPAPAAAALASPVASPPAPR